MNKRKLLKIIVLEGVIDSIADENANRVKKKRLWSQEWYLNRDTYSHATLLKELNISSPKDFKNFLRMNNETYHILLKKVKPLIEKQNTHMRDAISVNERLSLTLRFLASGQSFEDLKFLTAVSPQSVGKIVMETCCAIVKVLKEYLKTPESEEQWRKIADDFDVKWNFKHCLGAIDGKHVQIIKPAGSGSYYFNYKKTFSIVMLGLVNADYEFIMLEVGANGRVSDGGVFSNSKFHDRFISGELNIPGKENVDKFLEKLEYVFVGDDAFPLLTNLMKPYSGENLSKQQIIFNYRLSRARRVVENAFGIIANRFRFLLRPINFSPKKASILTLAACYLHNFLRSTNSDIYLRGSVDIENTPTGLITSASWRGECQQLIDLQASQSRNSSTDAKTVRKNFTDYFNGVGAVPWQQVV